MNSNSRTYPQTGIQTIGPLLLQLQDLGFEEASILKVNRAYHFAMQLWAVNFQSSSRPFICHAVGTASKTAEYGGSLDEILAALTHAAYTTGDFGVRVPGASKRKRRKMRKIIGVKAEILVHGFYYMLEHYGSHWEQILEEKPSADLPSKERSVLFIRVCNDLDDITDQVFSSNFRRGRIGDFCQGSIKLANYIGRQDLAKLLEADYSKYRDQDYLPFEVSQRHASGHVVLPAAYRKRFIPGVLEVVHRFWKTGSWRVRK